MRTQQHGRHGQHAPHTPRGQEANANGTGNSAGILVTRVRSYNIMTAVLFAGRRGALDARLARDSGALPGDSVLDVGSGPGHFARRLARTVGARGQVTGVDASEPMLDHARKHAALPNCAFHYSLAQAIELPDASFDVVTCTFVLHHIPPEARHEALAEIHRVLRPGGRLLLADAYPTGALATNVARWLGHTSMRRPTGADDAEHSHEVDPFADTDVSAHTAVLRELGFTGLYVKDVRPWTRCLRAVKSP